MHKLAAKLLDKEDWLLRFAISFTLFWVGIGELVNPTDWIGFVPQWIDAFIARDAFLVAHAFVWIIAGMGIVTGLWRPFFSAIATLGIVSILIFYGVDDITFRDVGLAVMAFILFLREVR